MMLLRACELVRRAHERVTHLRRSWLDHIPIVLVGDYDLVTLKKLDIPKKGQSPLLKSILDATCGELEHQLRYKAGEAGAWAVAVVHSPRRFAESWALHILAVGMSVAELPPLRLEV